MDVELLSAEVAAPERAREGRRGARAPAGEGAARPEPPDDIGAGAVALLGVLANRTRRRVFLALMRGETCNCELAADLGLKENVISHHVRRLRAAGFVRERRHERDARWVYYTLDRDALTAAWRALGAAVDPATIGERVAARGPAALDRAVGGAGAGAPAPASDVPASGGCCS